MPGDEAGVAATREPLSSKEMFGSVQRIVAGEVQANQEDVTCLREVCDVLTESYDSMERRTGVLQEALVELQKDYQEIQPHFAQIDALDMYGVGWGGGGWGGFFCRQLCIDHKNTSISSNTNKHAH